jgi:hypothetical protein
MAYFEKTNLVDSNGILIDANNPLPVSESPTLISLFLRLLNLVGSPVGFDKSIQRYRQTAIIESGTVTAVTTVTTVTNLTNINGNIGIYQATQQVFGQNMTAWQACVRSRIT